MKTVKITILIMLVIAVMAASSGAGWIIYHKSEFKGKVVDSETKHPLEGAVVVAVYNKTTMGLGAGSISSIINVREALTDTDGRFNIPSYTTIIQPFSWEDSATFIVFKPGYVAVSGLNLEDFLSDGKAKETELPWMYNKDLKFRFASGVVGLPEARTREERWHASFVGVTGYSEKELPLLYKARREEDEALGIK